MKPLKDQKTEALKTYKETKTAYMQDIKNSEKWVAFCEAKRACMMLGVRI